MMPGNTTTKNTFFLRVSVVLTIEQRMTFRPVRFLEPLEYVFDLREYMKAMDGRVKQESRIC